MGVAWLSPLGIWEENPRVCVSRHGVRGGISHGWRGAELKASRAAGEQWCAHQSRRSQVRQGLQGQGPCCSGPVPRLETMRSLLTVPGSVDFSSTRRDSVLDSGTWCCQGRRVASPPSPWAHAHLRCCLRPLVLLEPSMAFWASRGL